MSKHDHSPARFEREIRQTIDAMIATQRADIVAAENELAEAMKAEASALRLLVNYSSDSNRERYAAASAAVKSHTARLEVLRENFDARALAWTDRDIAALALARSKRASFGATLQGDADEVATLCTELAVLFARLKAQGAKHRELSDDERKIARGLGIEPLRGGLNTESIFASAVEQGISAAPGVDLADVVAGVRLALDVRRTTNDRRRADAAADADQIKSAVLREKDRLAQAAQ